MTKYAQIYLNNLSKKATLGAAIAEGAGGAIGGGTLGALEGIVPGAVAGGVYGGLDQNPEAKEHRIRTMVMDALKGMGLGAATGGALGATGGALMGTTAGIMGGHLKIGSFKSANPFTNPGNPNVGEHVIGTAPGLNGGPGKQTMAIGAQTQVTPTPLQSVLSGKIQPNPGLHMQVARPSVPRTLPIQAIKSANYVTSYFKGIKKKATSTVLGFQPFNSANTGTDALVGAGVGAIPGAAIGGLSGLIAPGHDEEGHRRSRIAEALKGSLIGGAMTGAVGAGAGALLPTAAEAVSNSVGTSANPGLIQKYLGDPLQRMAMRNVVRHVNVADILDAIAPKESLPAPALPPRAPAPAPAAQSTLFPARPPGLFRTP